MNTLIDRIQWPAVRAFRRTYGMIAQARAEAARFDALFDAGEFSGPADAEDECDAYNACVDRVALRFGVNPDELRAWLFFSCENEFQIYYRALHARKENRP